jgi:hypothetical protein
MSARANRERAAGVDMVRYPNRALIPSTGIRKEVEGVRGGAE